MSAATAPETRRRPVIVTIAVVCAYVAGIANTALGILVLLSRYEVPADAVLPVSLTGAAIILFGLLTLGVASALARGSRLARLLATIYLALEFALHAWTIASTDWDPTAIALMVVDAFVITALWIPAGARHFRH